MGTGGQGILTAGTVLAHAAVENGMEVALAPVYSAEVRGGTSFVELIISDRPIENPFMDHADIIICLTEKDFDSLIHHMNDKTEFFSDESVDIKNIPCNCRKTRLKFLDENTFRDSRKVGLILLGFVIQHSFREFMCSAENEIMKKRLCTEAEWITIRETVEQLADIVFC